ncbi:DUF2897 family protein [Agaribacter flavus]|uniref:DUF2897 family protein n=1 Tax=Agaribacter flavus TaxID=1902781 RepID=A0ABV7FT04_9ALTE
MTISGIIIVIVLALGIIVGNILLLRDSKGFPVPKGFKKRPDSEYDKDDDKD